MKKDPAEVFIFIIIGILAFSMIIFFILGFSVCNTEYAKEERMPMCIKECGKYSADAIDYYQTDKYLEVCVCVKQGITFELT